MTTFNTKPERERVNVTFEGERIGTATISDNGTLDMLITSQLLAKRLRLGTIEHFSINPKLKE